MITAVEASNEWTWTRVSLKPFIPSVTVCDLSGPNDIVFDRSGGFWFTDTGKLFPRTTSRGGIYYAQPDGSSIREVLYPREFPNGIALSLMKSDSISQRQ